MANSNRMVNIQITSNSEKAQKDMAILSRLIEQIQQRMQAVAADSSMGAKERRKAIKSLMADEAAYQKMYDRSVDALTRVNNVIVDLANSSTRDLKRAFNGAAKSILDMSESDPRLEETKKKMSEIQAQIRKNLSAMVDMEKNIGRLGKVSDDWLSTALKSQKELVAYLDKEDADYIKQLGILKQLTAEEEKRRLAAKPTEKGMNGHEARKIMSNVAGNSVEQVNEAVRVMEQLQKKVAVGSNVWKAYEERIRSTKEEMERLAKTSKMMDPATAHNILKNVGSYKEADVRKAIEKVTEQRDRQAMGSAEWEKYNKLIVDAQAQMERLHKSQLKISDGMKDLHHQSDQWLTTAIKQQKEYVASLKMTDSTYKDELTTLEQLTKEENRRKQKYDPTDARRNAFSIAQEGKVYEKDVYGNRLQDADGKFISRDASLADMKEAKKQLEEFRDQFATSEKNVKIYNDALADLEERMRTLTNATDKAIMSEQEYTRVISNLKNASLEDLKRAADETRRRLEKMIPNSVEAIEMRDVLKQIDKEMKHLDEDTVNVNKVLRDMRNGTATLDDLKRAAKQLGDRMEHMVVGSDKMNTAKRDLTELKKKIEDVTGAAKKQSSTWTTAFKNLTAYVGLFGAFNFAKSKIEAAIKKNFDYSASLTDIRKVSGMTKDEVNALSKSLATIDTRTSVDGLAQLAYQGAKLGMSQYGVSGMAAFVRAADQINVAIGEEMGEEALPALSKMVETMGLIPKMGIERSLLATGSAMFKLATTSTATSNNITEFAKRCTGVSRTAGITTDQLLALGSAFDAQMASPEVAATAMSKFIVALQKNHNLIEKDLGIEPGTIKNLYAAGNAMDAIVLVLEKMKAKGNMNALGGVFKDVGGDGQRLISAMVTMSKNVDMLKDHLATSNEAFEEASAVTKEYKMQQESAQAVLERANNLWEKAFVNPDGVNMVQSMAQAWYNMSLYITESPILKGSLVAALQTLMFLIKGFIVVFPALLQFLMMRGVAEAVIQVIRVYTQLKTAVMAATGAQVAMNMAMKANVFAAIASVVVAVAGAVWGYANAAKEAAKAQKEAEFRANAWKETIKKAHSETDQLTKKLSSYKAQLESTALGEKERNKALNRFNSDFRQYISNLGIEIKNVNDLKNHYHDLAEEIQRATYYRMREQAKEDALPKFREDRLAADNSLKEWINRNKAYQGFTTKSIMNMMAKGANAEWIYQQMMFGANPNMAAQKDKVSFDKGKDGKFDGGWTWTMNNGVRAHGGDKVLLSRLRYYQNATRREQAKSKEIDEYYKDFVTDNYTPWAPETPGTLENDAPDGTTSANDQRRAWREELKSLQDEAKAIMADVQNFYERQITQKLNEAMALGLSETEKKEFIAPLEKRMNESLKEVRLAISGQSDVWDTYKASLADDKLEGVDESTGIDFSQNLLDSIQKNNIAALRKKMGALAKNLGMPQNAVTAEIFKNASLNEQKNANIDFKQQEARRKLAMEHDYTGTVQNSTYEQFNTLGFAKTLENPDKADFEARKADIIDLLEKSRSEIVAVLASKGDKTSLMSTLFGKDWKTSLATSQFAPLLNIEGKEFELFYQKLLQYNDEYTQAQKKQYDEQKKVVEMQWKLKGNDKSQTSRQQSLDKFNKLYGEQNTFASRLGFSNKAYDPEIESYKLKLQFAREYYEYIMETSTNAQLQKEAELSMLEAQNALTIKLVEQMRERMQLVKDFAQPIVDFGSAAGEALAQFSDDVDSAQEAMRNAVKSMLKSWGEMMIKNLMNQMWQGLNDSEASKIDRKTSPVSVVTNIGSSAISSAAKAGLKGSDFTQPQKTKDSNHGNSDKKPEKNVPETKTEYVAPDEFDPDEVVTDQSNTSSVKEEKSANDQGVDVTPSHATTPPTQEEPPAPDEDYDAPVREKSGQSTPRTRRDGNSDISPDRTSDEQEKAPQMQDTANDAVKKVVTPLDDSAVGEDGETVDQEGQVDSALSMEEDKYERLLEIEAAYEEASLEQWQAYAEKKREITGESQGEDASDANSDAVDNKKAKNDAELEQQKDHNANLLNLEQAGKSSIMSLGKKAFTRFLGQKKKQSKQEEKLHKDTQKDITTVEKEGGDTREKIEKTSNDAIISTTKTAGQQLLATKKANDQAESQQEGAKQQQKAAMHSVGLFGWCVDTLGPIAGPIAYAAVESVLMGLLQYALSFIGGSASSEQSKTSVNTKLVSGMLTYDKGNLQQLYIGNDGRIYSAQEQSEGLSTGIVDHPIATTVNGAPSLVAENGPELVVGRETTAAMMQNAPALLQTLLQFDKNHSLQGTPFGKGMGLYDSGNIQDTLGNSLLSDASLNSNDNTALMTVLTQMHTLLTTLNTNGVQASIGMYGRNGLYNQLGKANQFMKGK